MRSNNRRPTAPVVTVRGAAGAADNGSAAASTGSKIDDHQILRGAAGLMRSVPYVLFAAEALGVAQATLDTAVECAQTRVQFGQPIGSFQAVKHHCANVAVKAELATAAVWDVAARRPATHTSNLSSPPRRQRLLTRQFTTRMI